MKPLRGEPDLVLFGGPVATVDRGFRVTDAVAIKDGHIMAVGESAEVRALAGPHTEAVDLRGCMALPGFIDSHCHPTQVGLRRLKLDLMDCRSIAEVLERVSARAAQSPPGQWVEGGLGWREDWLAERRLPTRQELDRAAPAQPVYLPHLGYTVVVNSTALAAAGIDRSSPDPDGGTICRDASGEPNGVLVGTSAFRLVERLIPPPGDEQRLECLRFACRQNSSWGKTGAIDAGLNPLDMRTYHALRQRGDLTVRTSMMFRPDTSLPLDALLESLRAWGVSTGFGDDMLSVGGIKMFLDGGIEGALLREPYANDPTYYGVVGVQQTLLYNLAPNFAGYWGQERVERANPQRDWLDNGVPLAGGIDGTPFPIVLAIWSCVTRGTRDAGIVGADQRIGREEAIRMYTIGSAYALHEEHLKGSLEPGKLADVIILDRDILRCPEDEIKDAEVLVTLLGGTVVHGTFDALGRS